MQLQSKDGRITISVSEDPIRKSSMPQADFSFIEAPMKMEDTRELFSSLFKTQRNNHISLVSVRLPKKMRLKAFANLAVVEDTGFKYHDHITVVSEEEYKHIPSNLTQIGETYILFTKGDDLNKKATSWFREDIGNCSNVWDVAPQEGESMVTRSISRHFCWEQGILMAQLSSPLICRKFLVIGIVEPSMAEFAYRFNLSLHASTTDEISARRVIKLYHKFLDKKESGR